MGHLAPGDIFENMLEIIISATEMLGGSGTCSRKNFEMIDTIWCVLMYYFD